VIVSFSEAPNTEGEVAEKYIEIDLSQQKMYLWEGGENVAVHRVSSGLYYATPPGHYQILNKANNAYSYIYHVWMPFWMAFSLDPQVNAYLGIHELPYWVDGVGQEIRRPRDFIGSPHTGGCVSLDVGEAELVYNWAEVGTPVWIFE
jgi:lipoprotein-anchoring transpeptidase ErfK/SrfK